MSRVVAVYTEEERREIVQAVLENMATGNSLTRACEVVGADEASFLRWLEADAAAEIEYERLKISRARSLIEKSLGMLETLEDPAEARLVDIKVKHQMRLAALLNPKEFSDKTHHNGVKGQGSRAVGFVFNIGTAQGETVTVTAREIEHEE